jgi:beta-lactamase class D
MLRSLLVSLFFVTSSIACASQTAFIFQELDAPQPLVSAGHVNERITPCSTFKIPLALIGFEKGILTDKDMPVWDYKEGYMAITERHKQPLSPQTWMWYSAAWYSQLLTQELGMEDFQTHVNILGYGNRDLSGDPGKNNGLTHSWLCSSLEITPQEQVHLVTKLIKRELGFKAATYEKTREILRLEEQVMPGWTIYAKTGSGRMNAPHETLGLGWFVGWLEGQDQNKGKTYVFAFQIKNVPADKGYGGPVAKKEALELLRKELKL